MPRTFTFGKSGVVMNVGEDERIDLSVGTPRKVNAVPMTNIARRKNYVKQCGKVRPGAQSRRLKHKANHHKAEYNRRRRLARAAKFQRSTS